MAEGRAAAARAIALAGPAGTGKTTLMEALLFASGAIPRQGGDGATIGDASPEARARGQSVELNLANFTFMGDRYAVIDCAGLGGVLRRRRRAPCRRSTSPWWSPTPIPTEAVLLQPVLKALERHGRAPRPVRQQDRPGPRRRSATCCRRCSRPASVPLVARQIPIWEDDQVTGFVDLALERAFVYRPGKESEQVDIPDDLAALEADARFHMLEQLADYDDAPDGAAALRHRAAAATTVFADLVRETREGLIVPVFFGSAHERLRRAPPAQGAAPRHARAGGRRRAAGRQRQRAPMCSRPPTPARPASSPMPGCCRRPDRRRRRPDRARRRGGPRQRPVPAAWASRPRRSPPPRPARSWPSARSRRPTPASCCRPTASR